MLKDYMSSSKDTIDLLVVTLNPVGGIRTYLRYIYGNKVFSSNNNILLTTDADESISTQSGFSKVFTANQRFIFIKFVIKFICLSFLKKPRVIHCHGLKSGVLSMFFLRLLSCRSVLTLHDVFSEYQFKGIRGRLKYQFVNFTFKSFDYINPCGSDVQENLERFFPFLNKNKIVTIRNGVESQPLIIAEKRDLKRELELPEGSILLGFFGRFMNQKGFDLIRKGILMLSSETREKIFVVSFGWGGYIREEQEEIRKAKLDKHFFFLPHTDKIGSSLKGCDGVIAPSRWEACPLLPMEVFITGVPLIASDCIGMKEVCIDSPAIIHETNNPKSIANKIDEFANEINVRKSQSKDFSKQAILKFDVDLVAKQVFALLYKTNKK